MLGLLGVALVLAGASRSTPSAASAGSVDVVLTAHQVPAGSLLTGADLTVATVPSVPAVEALIHGVAGVVGRRAAVALPAGAVLTDAALLDPAAPQPGHRLVRLQVDAASLPPDLRADQLVDVLAAVADGSAPSGRVALVATGRLVALAGAPSPAPSGAAGEAVTLDVDAAAAERLLWAESFAKALRVLSRPAADDASIPAEIDGVAAEAPAR